MKTTITILTLLISLNFISMNMMQAQTGNNSNNLTQIEELGKQLFFDKIADPDNMSCADCHGPNVGFTGPNPGINKKGAVYMGAVAQRFGNRKPPSAAYATLSPVFYYDEDEELFIGGNFWDGRATGEHLGNPAADQALGPFLNPVEQNNASKMEVLVQVAKSKYSGLWETVWGEPISYETPEKTETNYDRIGLAIAAYEGSSEVNQFSSKYDYYLQGLVDLSEEEMMGMNLFNGVALCSECHISEPGPGGEPPLFTDFTFDNLGTPKNPKNPFYDMDEVFLSNGDPINPMGDDWIDPGLGGFLATHPNPVWQAMADENMGKHKVPTLRNVAKSPGGDKNKAFMHNGVFKSLKEVVHFYNTRDVESWPPPEVAANVNTDELGDLGLTEEEEDAIVAFMNTLSDGYVMQKSSIDLTNIDSKVEASLNIGPNPFNANTNINIYLPETSEIEIAIYSLNGEKISTIEKGWYSAGKTSIQYIGTNLKNGVYIVSMQVDEQVLTQKITFVK